MSLSARLEEQRAKVRQAPDLAALQLAASGESFEGQDQVAGAQQVQGLGSELRHRLRGEAQIGRRRAPDAGSGPYIIEPVWYDSVERVAHDGILRGEWCVCAHPRSTHPLEDHCSVPRCCCESYEQRS